MPWKKHRVLKHVKFKSIQSRIAVAFSLLILFTVLVIAFVSYRLSADAVERNSTEYTYQLIQQVNANIETYISYMDNISQMVLNNYDVKEYLSKPAASADDGGLDQQIAQQFQEQKISEQFTAIINARKDISSIMIFGSNGKFVSNNKHKALNAYANLKEQGWYRAALEADGKAVVSSSHIQNIFEDEYRWVVSLSRKLTSGDGKEATGVFLVDLNYSVINDMCNEIKLGKKGYIFILDKEGNIVYHPQQQLIYSNLKTELVDQVLKAKSSSFTTNEGKDSRMYTIKESAGTGWKIVGVAYVDELVANKKETQTYYILGAIGFMLIAIALSVIISSRISRPIRQLEVSMKKVEKGNFDSKVEITSLDEVGELSRAFNIMMDEIKALMRQNVKEQELKRKSELKALQAQINPHFLYNTLDSIIWMAEGRKSEEVVLMTSALAKLFRLSISKGEELITLFSEVEHIKSYLTIQEMRYRNKLNFEIQVEEEILHYKVLKIILQPLVENSIYHGIKNKNGDGLIRIIGKQVADKILLQVMDNGVGMTPEEMRKIFEKSDKSRIGSGVGVRNVNERIKLYFGDEYGLSFESELDKGTTANVWLPVLE